ncbi:MAG: hypothetical protein IJY42_06230, partial [Clostridia bacterium]|nr:hypothetical protein [Clostridia bacterium]
PREITAFVAIAGLFMPALTPISLLAAATYPIQVWHYDVRAELNEGVPEKKPSLEEHPEIDNSIAADFHQLTAGDKKNEKLCWPDGKEGIYQGDSLVTDPRDIGTYNFFMPTDPWNTSLHIVFDVFPWVVFGNNDDDPGPIINYPVKWTQDFIQLFI